MRQKKLDDQGARSASAPMRSETAGALPHPGADLRSTPAARELRRASTRRTGRSACSTTCSASRSCARTTAARATAELPMRRASARQAKSRDRVSPSRLSLQHRDVGGIDPSPTSVEHPRRRHVRVIDVRMAVEADDVRDSYVLRRIPAARTRRRGARCPGSRCSDDACSRAARDLVVAHAPANGGASGSSTSDALSPSSSASSGSPTYGADAVLRIRDDVASSRESERVRAPVGRHATSRVDAL